MFKRNWAVLIVIMCSVVFLADIGFTVEKADKDAILQEISSFIDKNPDILRSAVFSMADDYQRNNKTDDAISLYEKALKVLPDNEDFLNRLANLYNQKTDYAKSAEIYAKLAGLKPENIWYYNMLSDTYRNAKQNDKAAAVWEDLMKKSSNADVFNQAANFYSRGNNMDKAISAMKKAVELKPDNLGYLQNLESFYMRAEKFSDAEAVCGKVMADAKDQWAKDWVNAELISIYQKQNKIADLTAKFEKDLAQAPNDISQYRKLADLYQRNNERDKAAGVYEKAVSAAVADRDINNRLLELYEASGNFEKAEQQIKKIMASAPNDNYLNERLANLLSRAGRKDDAKKAWQDFLAKAPNDAGTFSRFADRLNEWGDVDGAIAQYRKAQSLDANNLWYTMRVADVLIANQRSAEAKKELETIAAKTNDNWLKQEAQRKIGEIGAKTAPAVLAAPAPAAAGLSKEPAPKQTKAKKGLFGR